MISADIIDAANSQESISPPLPTLSLHHFTSYKQTSWNWSAIQSRDEAKFSTGNMQIVIGSHQHPRMSSQQGSTAVHAECYKLVGLYNLSCETDEHKGVPRRGDSNLLQHLDCPSLLPIEYQADAGEALGLARGDLFQTKGLLILESSKRHDQVKPELVGTKLNAQLSLTSTVSPHLKFAEQQLQNCVTRPLGKERRAASLIESYRYKSAHTNTSNLNFT